MADELLAGHDPTAVLEVARTVAVEAGELLLESFGQLAASQIRSKSAARDLVTEADLASERLLVARLRECFPEHRIESEEEVRDAPDDDAPRWFLDPLDGTVNFVHGLPAFAVSMGLWAGGEPRVAVVHLPRLDETFCAVRGGGAWLGERRLRVSRTAELGQAVLATGFPYRRGELEHSNLENFNRFFYDLRGVRRTGAAAVDLAYVAAGRLDGFWELHLSPHDVAAGALLVREAGGVVTDADGGEDWLRGGHLVAAGRALQPQIRARVEH
ncbi:MAG: inositol monophosphatase [Planctomycetes bacterium]|nr:inositol monophosphatase [Planctomycetota bacterium]